MSNQFLNFSQGEEYKHTYNKNFILTPIT